MFTNTYIFVLLLYIYHSICPYTQHTFSIYTSALHMYKIYICLKCIYTQVVPIAQWLQRFHTCSISKISRAT